MSNSTVQHSQWSPLLWASAVLLAGMIMLQLGGPTSPVVHADMIVQQDGYTMLTMRGRSVGGDKDAETLILLDSGEGWLLAYEFVGPATNRRIEPVDGGPLAYLFERGGQSPAGPSTPRP